jgi:hypothetical protein
MGDFDSRKKESCHVKKESKDPKEPWIAEPQCSAGSTTDYYFFMKIKNNILTHKVSFYGHLALEF